MQFCYFTYIRRPDLRVPVPILPLRKIECFLDKQHFQKYCRNTAYNIIMDVRDFFTKQIPNANPPKIEDDAPPSKQRNSSDHPGNASSSTPSTSNVTNVSHLSSSDFRRCSSSQRHRLTVHRPVMQVQQLIRTQQPTACLFRFVTI